MFRNRKSLQRRLLVAKRDRAQLHDDLPPARGQRHAAISRPHLAIDPLDQSLALESGHNARQGRDFEVRQRCKLYHIARTDMRQREQHATTTVFHLLRPNLARKLHCDANSDAVQQIGYEPFKIKGGLSRSASCHHSPTSSFYQTIATVGKNIECQSYE